MNVVTHCLALPEILENIFSYITDYKDFVNLFRVNHIWKIEAVRAILKLYKDRFYRYNHNTHNILLISDFYSNIFGVHKPVYNKIYRLGLGENRRYIDYEKEFEKIQSNIKNTIIELQTLYNESLPSAKQDNSCLTTTKKIDNLISDYLLLEIKVDNTLLIFWF